MLLEILQCDIDGAVRHDCYQCVIARAVERVTGSPAFVGTIGVVVKGRQYFTQSPYAREYRRAFDRGEVVTPTTLELLEKRHAA